MARLLQQHFESHVAERFEGFRCDCGNSYTQTIWDKDGHVLYKNPHSELFTPPLMCCGKVMEHQEWGYQHDIEQRAILLCKCGNQITLHPNGATVCIKCGQVYNSDGRPQNA